MTTLFPKLYDFFMKPLEARQLKRIRTKLLGNSYGKVIEIGSGTGVNFPLYRHVESVTAIEPNYDMIQRSLKNKVQASVPITIIQESAESLPFADNTYDTVVATLVFCTIPDVNKALDELKRICKPNGKILMFEHVRMKHPTLAKLQDLLTPMWRKMVDGCCLNRDTVGVIKSKGFQIINIHEYYRGLFVVIEIQNSK